MLLICSFFSESLTTKNPKSDHFAHFIVFVTGVQSMPTVYCPPIHKYSVHILFGRSHKQRPLSNVHSSHHMVSITAFIIMKWFLPKASDKSKPNSFAHWPMCLSHHHIFPVSYWSAGLVHVFSSSVKMTYPPEPRRVRSKTNPSSLDFFTNKRTKIKKDESNMNGTARPRFVIQTLFLITATVIIKSFFLSIAFLKFPKPFVWCLLHAKYVVISFFSFAVFFYSIRNFLYFIAIDWFH